MTWQSLGLLVRRARGRSAGLGILAFLLLALSLRSPSSAVAVTGPPRLALLVGVSNYPRVAGKTPWNALHTHDEITALRQVLIEQHGFLPKDIVVLEDDKASGRAIREAVRSHLIARAQKGAVVFFHFSGHGQQIVDRSGDETDRLDESIVPGDAQDQGAVSGATTNILDDEIADWLRALGGKLRGKNGQVEGSIVLSFDSCYSGTLSRGELVERGRPWDVRLDGEKPQPLTEAERSQRKLPAVSPTLDLDPRDYVMLTAARSDQTAKERRGMGVYTRALVAALTRLPKTTTYRALMHAIAIEMRQAVSNQDAELEGDPERTLFGGLGGQAPTPYLSVLQASGDQLEVPAGSLHLVTAGSVYALHRPGDGPMDAKTLLGDATAHQVGPTKSWLQLRPGSRIPIDDLRAARVVEKEHAYPDSPLLLRCNEAAAKANECKSPALQAALAPLVQSKLLRWVAADAQPGSVDYDLRIVPSPSAIQLFRPETGTALASIPRAQKGTAQAGQPSDALKILADRLRAEWRWRRLFALHGQSPSIQVGLRIVPAQAGVRDGLATQLPVAQIHAAAASKRLQPDDTYQLEINNPLPYPIWVSVLELGPDGSISVLYPNEHTPGDNRFASGAMIPPQALFQASLPYGKWTLKAIATLEPADFRSLVQNAATLSTQTAPTRGPDLMQRASSHPLGQLLLEAASGGLVRSRVVGVPIGTWAIADALLEVPEPDSPAAGR